MTKTTIRVTSTDIHERVHNIVVTRASQERIVTTTKDYQGGGPIEPQFLCTKILMMIIPQTLKNAVVISTAMLRAGPKAWRETTSVVSAFAIKKTKQDEQMRSPEDIMTRAEPNQKTVMVVIDIAVRIRRKELGTASHAATTTKIVRGNEITTPSATKETVDIDTPKTKSTNTVTMSMTGTADIMNPERRDTKAASLERVLPLGLQGPPLLQV